MIRRTVVFIGTFAFVCGAGVASAQTASRPRTGVIPAAPQTSATPRPATKPRIGLIPPSPPAAPTQMGQTGYGQSGYGQTAFGQAGYGQTGYNVAPQVMQFYYLPTVVLSDGRVLANFGTGRGYEQVLRQCPILSGTLPPNFAVSPCWTVDAYGRYSVIQQR